MPHSQILIEWGLVCVVGMIVALLRRLEQYFVVPNSRFMKVKGLLAAIQWVKDLEFQEMIFEMDAKYVVDNFNNNQLD